jgi:hypothetical protein
MGTVGTQSINAALYPKMPFDPVRDFAPITLVAGVPNVRVLGWPVAGRVRDLHRGRDGQVGPGREDVGSEGRLNGPGARRDPLAGSRAGLGEPGAVDSLRMI